MAVDAPGRDSYSYAIPPELAAELGVGDGVEVPYGRQRLKGFVLRRHRQQPQGSHCVILYLGGQIAVYRLNYCGS